MSSIPIKEIQDDLKAAMKIENVPSVCPNEIKTDMDLRNLMVWTSYQLFQHQKNVQTKFPEKLQEIDNLCKEIDGLLSFN